MRRPGRAMLLALLALLGASCGAEPRSKPAATADDVPAARSTDVAPATGPVSAAPPPRPAEGAEPAAPREPLPDARAVAAPGLEGGDASFALSMKTSDSGADCTLYGGESLRSGDQFWFEVKAFRALHVYVLLLSPSGDGVVLYPSAGEATLSPGVMQRIPGDDGAFELDSHPGEERLLVVGSTRPLAVTDPALSRAIQRIRGAPHESRAAKSRPPGAEGARAAPVEGAASAAVPGNAVAPRSADVRHFEDDFQTRGVFVTTKKGGASMTVKPDADGVFVAPLVIRHLPRR